MLSRLQIFGAPPAALVSLAAGVLVACSSARPTHSEGETSASDGASESSGDDSSTQACSCFEASTDGVTVACGIPASCGTVVLSFNDEGTGGAPDPAEEQVNDDVMACLLTAASTGQPARMGATSGDPSSAYFTEYDVVLFAEGDAAYWSHVREDLIEEIAPVQLHLGVAATLADCEGVSDSVEQWQCIRERVTAGPAQAECTEAVDLSSD